MTTTPLHTLGELLEATDARDLAELGTRLTDWWGENDITVHPTDTGIELREGALGTHLTYPFTLEDVHDAVLAQQPTD